jgi:dihydrofolate reductase
VSVPPFKLSSSSAEVFERLVESAGAVVTGRRTYDIAGAWGGNGPVPGLPVFVVTHNVPEHVPQGESRYTFVTDGVESAIEQAKAAAGDKYVLGGGVRLFDQLGSESIELETIQVVDSPGVTHLRFRVVR